MTTLEPSAASSARWSAAVLLLVAWSATSAACDRESATTEPERTKGNSTQTEDGLERARASASEKLGNARVDALVRTGRQLVDEGDMESAVRVFEQAHVRASEATDVALEFGWVLFRAGRLEQSRGINERIVESADASNESNAVAKAEYHLGRIAAVEGCWAEARRHLERSDELRPDETAREHLKRARDEKHAPNRRQARRLLVRASETSKEDFDAVGAIRWSGLSAGAIPTGVRERGGETVVVVPNCGEPRIYRNSHRLGDWIDLQWAGAPSEVEAAFPLEYDGTDGQEMMVVVRRFKGGAIEPDDRPDRYGDHFSAFVFDWNDEGLEVVGHHRTDDWLERGERIRDRFPTDQTSADDDSSEPQSDE